MNGEREAAAAARPEIDPVPVAADDWPPPSVGWLEVALPLWHRRWWLLLASLLGLAGGLGLALLQPVRYTGRASFVVQSVPRPSASAVASTLPQLAGLVGGGMGPGDLQLTILRSRTVNDHIVDRFDLQRHWGLAYREQALMRVARRADFSVGRRDGVVQVDVEDEDPQRAAALANEFIEELRLTLRRFALDEAKQRRAFYDAQLARARQALEQAQQRLRGSGFDRAALRAEPRAAAEAYGRMQGEVAAAEVRLAATRRVRADGSSEVQQQLSELAALRSQLGTMETPRDDAPGSFVSRLREFRYAESLAESVARQAESARVDEASEPLPLQVLDRAQASQWPTYPRALQWALYGFILALAVVAAGILTRHRMALARLDPRYSQRLALVRSVLPRRRP